MNRSRNDKVIESSEKYSIKSTAEGVHSLTVLDIDAASDAGDYLFVAKNAGGSLKCTASLSVQGQRILYKCNCIKH
jgi:hypothetical protein